VNNQLYYGIEASGMRQREFTNRGGINAVGHAQLLSYTDAVVIGYFFESTGDSGGCGWNWATAGPGGNPLWGRVKCVKWHPNSGRCDQHHLEFNANRYNEWAGGGYQESLACHEVSHAFGLTHARTGSGSGNPGGCVRIDPGPGGYNAIDAKRTTLSNHDVNHLLAHGS
jgi:hypothetical protein